MRNTGALDAASALRVRRSEPSYVVSSEPHNSAEHGRVVAILDKHTRRQLDWLNIVSSQHMLARVRQYLLMENPASTLGCQLRTVCGNPLITGMPLTTVLGYLAYKTDKFNAMQSQGVFAFSVFKDIASVTVACQGSLKAIKKTTNNFFGHRLQVKCEVCAARLQPHSMKACTICLVHVPVCGPECFGAYWERTHRAACGERLRYTEVAPGSSPVPVILAAHGGISALGSFLTGSCPSTTLISTTLVNIVNMHK